MKNEIIKKAYCPRHVPHIPEWELGKEYAYPNSDVASTSRSFVEIS